MRIKCLIPLLLLLLLFSLTGCRRRIMADAEQVIYETYLQPEPSKPTEPSTEPTEESTQTPTEPSTAEPAPSTSEPAHPNFEESTVIDSSAPTESTPPPPTEPVTVEIRLDANRGQCPEETLTRHTGEPYGALPEASRAGFTFTGWYFAQNGGTRVTSDTTVTSAASHTLYAHWAARSAYALTFDANGGRLEGGEAERMVYAGDSYGTLPLPVRRGYDFTGWFTAPEGGTPVQPSDVFSSDRNQTLYAQWSYNPYDYWSFQLENIGQQVYACQQLSVYWEYEADCVTTNYCPLLAATGSYNIAQNREDVSVTDEWVLEKNPQVIVKCAGGAGSGASYYSAMSARFPGRRILIVPTSAVYGSPAETVYYGLYFGQLLYPEWYGEIDLTTVAAELGVSGSIYG